MMCKLLAVWALLSTLISEALAGDGPSDHEIDIVQDSWTAVESTLSHEEVGVILYQNIFTLSPEAEQLFPFKGMPDLYNTEPLKRQGRAVVDAVAVAVQGLRHLDEVVPILQSLGTRHAGRGIVQAHYDVVGQALLATLSAGLGEAWSDELSVAWTKVYGVVADTMHAAQLAAEPDGNHGHFCSVCGHQYYAPEDGAGDSFDMLPDDWVCPVCASPKSAFNEQLDTDMVVGV